MDRPRPPRIAFRTMVPIVGLSTVSVAPAFFVGALGVDIRTDLGFGPAALGLAVSIYFLATAITTHTFGRFTDRVGARVSGRLAVSLISVSLIGMAILAREWWVLVAILIIAGMGNAMAGPTTSLLLARSIPSSRLGFAFGIKQSSVPLATLLAGLAVPLLAVHIGWRWVMLITGVVTFAVIATIPETSSAGPDGEVLSHRARAPFPAMVFFAISFGLVIAAVTSLGALLVDSTVASGFSQSMGGTVLAIGSLTAVVARIAFGWWADRTTSNVLWSVVIMMGLGSIGYPLLGSDRLGIIIGGVIIAFGVGWGWSGLLMLSITKHNLGAPATATGIVQTGAAVGGVIGPSTIGLIAERIGYPTAWLTAGGLMILAAIAVLTATLLLNEHLKATGGAT